MLRNVRCRQNHQKKRVFKMQTISKKCTLSTKSQENHKNKKGFIKCGTSQKMSVVDQITKKSS